ncbi:lactase/phlorizin hydrolase [Anguilla rostrata]|uniref:lactase/phlorizin hydrolase n=1 Tax=Anguilla rostrata TaxID=7938 RepID=UPI0030D4938B
MVCHECLPTVKMKTLCRALSVLLLCCRVCSNAEQRQLDFMLLAGPLPARLHSFSMQHVDPQPLSWGGPGADAFGCKGPLPEQLRDYFRYIRARGVTHFKVPLSWSQLLPVGDPGQPDQQTVECYQAQLKLLKQAGLEPLVILHRSAIPEAFRARHGGWENQATVDLFERYAKFVFSVFGELADFWVTFSHISELVQEKLRGAASSSQQAAVTNALLAHEKVYITYHHLLSGGQVSLGVDSNDVSILSQNEATSRVPLDFLSVEVQYDCSQEASLEKELTTIQGTSGGLPVLIYQLDIKGCASEHDSYQSLTSILQVLRNPDLKILGCDIVNLFDQLSMDRTPKSPPNLIGKAARPSSAYKQVWEKFSVQTPADRDSFLAESFPEGFRWGASSESFKVEGGWAEHGKGETIWDRFAHEGNVLGNQTADLACDSYNKADYDVYLLRGLLSKTYQFSLSWARIFPSGHRGSQSVEGTLYYDKLIDALIQSNIQPVVTLHHWDLPQELQDYGGWTNDSITGAFREYADFCFSRFGNRVKTWNTFSSPWVISHAGYGTGEYPPGIKDPVVDSYKVTHTILKSHAEAWHVYNDKYRQVQGGKVGIALNSDWAEPLASSSPAQDVEAAERYLQFMLGWFAHPIFVDGDYPPLLKSQIGAKQSECPGAEPAVLPVFTDAERKRIQGTADFFGLNHYTSRLVNETKGGCQTGPAGVGDFMSHADPSWPTTASSWICSVPWGIRRILSFITAEYTSVTKVPIYVTGNGMPTVGGPEVLNDTERVLYLRSYINEALKAIRLDGVDLQGFTVQSLMDGFEGPQGYSERFGLHYVDFGSMDRPRTPKASAHFYTQIMKNNGFSTVRQWRILPSSSAPQFQTTRLSSLPPSEVPSKAKVVWEKFSRQSKFERKLYHYGTFPEGFHWGVSSSAYQVEGGWDADGKGMSVWDQFTHTPGSIPNNDNGDVACDSYRQTEEDLYMLRALGVTSYRFSLSWSRIFPNGQKVSLNQNGVDYYNKLIDGLLAHNITPIVTLYHWDLPQALMSINGWENVSTIALFSEFSEFCFAIFGDRVKFWVTFNEPYTIAWSGYGLGAIPPNVKNPADAPYRVAHNLLKAHAMAYRTYDEKYRKAQGGVVSISLNANWVEPKDVDIPREVMAADRAMQFQLGWFAHPIFKNGDYPDAMKWMVGNKSELQGLPESRLPVFTEQEKAYIRGTADVFCINAYTTKIVRHITPRLTPPSYEYDRDVGEAEETDSPGTAINGQRAVAWGLRRLLNWIKEEYSDPEIYITENGVATNSKTTVDDTDRIFFFKSYIDEALKAHNLDGVRLRGYVASSLMDSFEWLHGYTVGFGLHHVDFQHPMRPRTPKYSAHYYHRIMKDNGFPLPEDEKPIYGFFRKDFFWSTATASYQVEGGWRADGKGLSIWDKFAHTPLKVGNDDNGDIACDSYNKVEEDVAMLKRLRATHYRFSISWPRVLPDGTPRTINEAGLKYYHRLVDALLAANIQPQMTLYHWDLPQALQDQGGWENDTIVQRFKDYADVIFSSLGDKVKFWITINEPYNVANIGHGYGTAAPGISFRPGTLPYIVGHNLLKAHAEAWHLYNEKYRPKQGGIISITINSDWAEPRNPYKQEDIDSARRVVQFYIGWFAHPVFNGDYSDVMKNIIRERSLAAGLPKSRLPEFTPEEVQRIKGTYDYFGFNHYTTVLTFNVDYKNLQHYDADRGAGTIADRTWLDSGSAWLKVTPPGFRKILNFIKNEYGNPPIYITENGISERGPINLNDIHRIHYYENYINQALKAYLLDGVDIRGYTAWSLMDNLEWATGFAERFGLFHVNHSDPALPRVAKQSAARYATIITCNGFPDPALGSHECLTPEPEGTSSPSPSPPQPPPVKVPEVRFLGLEVSPSDAEVALYILFFFSIAGTIATILIAYRCRKATRKSQHEEHISLQKRF